MKTQTMKQHAVEMDTQRESLQTDNGSRRNHILVASLSVLTALCLALVVVPASAQPTFTCGNVPGKAKNNGNGTWTLSVVCADNVSFVGKATILNGNQSNLEIQGTWTDNGPKNAQALIDTFTIDLGFLWNLPPGGPITAWQQLTGTMSLPLVGALAKLTNVGFLNPCPGNQNTGTVTTQIMPTGRFNVRSDPVQCNGNPWWDRSATYTTEFAAGNGPNSKIILEPLNVGGPGRETIIGRSRLRSLTTTVRLMATPMPGPLTSATSSAIRSLIQRT